MSFEGHRPTMDQWSNRKGPEGIRRYWAQKNTKSIDRLDGVTTDSTRSGADQVNGAEH
jgi:hypothetical protein